MFAFILFCISILSCQVELTLNVEKLLPECLRKKWMIKTETLEPNKRSNILTRLLINENTMRSIARRVVSNSAGDHRGEFQAKQVKSPNQCNLQN